MKKTIFYWLLIAGCLFVCANSYAQSNTTNKGTEFWTLYMNHINGVTGNQPSQMSLYITSDISTTGRIEIADGSFSAIPFAVTANQVTTVNIPSSAYVGNEGQYSKGIHITSIGAIAVYAHIYAMSISGATLLLPVNTMGKNYYSLNYTQASNSANARSSFAVIATENNTTVEITPSATLTSGRPANVKFIVNLTKGELYEGLAENDLTGTLIKSVSTVSEGCKRIAVFSGSGKVGIGCTPTSATSDNLFQQVYPTAAWGKNYITAPLKGRPYDVYRIVISDPATQVKLNGTTLPASDFVNGFYYEFTGTTPNIVNADKPIQVIQYSGTQGRQLPNSASCSTIAGDVGDPEMIYLSPIEQSLDRVTLYSTDKYLITNTRHFINVIIPTTGVSSFVLDGSPYTTFTAVPGSASYSYAQINVAPGTHNISAAEGFNAIAYGFGNAESYGYAAGANLKNLNEFVQLADPVTSTAQTSGCANQNYNLQVTTHQTTNIKWFIDGALAFNDINPQPVKTTTSTDDTQILYIYQYNVPVTFAAGDHTVKASIFNPVADDCGLYQDVDFNFTINNLPGVNFSFSDVRCLGTATGFTYTPDASAGVIKSWLWSFGDGSTSAEQSPQHIYAAPGDYNVQLTVVNENNCSATSAIQTLHINKLPLAAFTYGAPDCAGQAITFTDVSTPVEGTIAKWIWNFDDGTTETRTDKLPFTHTFSNVKTYNVTLQVVNSTGCTSAVKMQPVIIYPLPVANFITPEICLEDVTARFTNASTIPDGTALTYLWNFGDPASGAANTSAVLNGQHNYSRTGSYHVTLTVKSANRCVSIAEKDFFVNGSIPAAKFITDPSNTYCSSNEVVFINQSAPDVGNIVKLRWYFDFINKPTEYIEYNNTTNPLHADNKYAYKYDNITDTSPRQYVVKLVAYSGETCFKEYTLPSLVIVNPDPKIKLTYTQADKLCQQASAVNITVDNPGYAGTGLFSGKGITAAGLFDPKIAGPGKHKIEYVFTTQANCTYYETFDLTVFAAPVVVAPTEITILSKGQIKINAIATSPDGSKLFYDWSPADGLDNIHIVDPIASPVTDTKYTLTVTSANGCAATATVFVKVLQAPVINNTFTPNGDGRNDTWFIQYLDSYLNCTVEIFNRNGEKVYSSVGYPVPWDGRYKGADLPAGVYYYMINPKNGRSVLSGSVTIIR